jgi:phosphatidate phosphatase LPIN
VFSDGSVTDTEPISSSLRHSGSLASAATNPQHPMHPDYLSAAKRQKRYRKTTRLSSEQIKKLNLKPGANEIMYSVTTALQGTTRIESYVFLWSYDDKIIISDIDGTITKSDVWGQVLPIFGRDWTQAGVADLFTAIERNKYKFMYLSARAIGQSAITRQLLNKINQDGFTLPPGPLLVTPTSLFTAFQKEVIEKKPEEFKISCLQDIKSLFAPDYNPYYAGYGNKTSDVRSYKTVGVPESRIFTINPQGEVKHEVSRTFQSSYSKLCDYVELIFPPFKATPNPTRTEYDSFSYWRSDPLSVGAMAEIEDEIKKLTASSPMLSKDTAGSAGSSPSSKDAAVVAAAALAVKEASAAAAAAAAKEKDSGNAKDVSSGTGSKNRA